MPRGYTISRDNHTVSDANPFLRIAAQTNRVLEITEIQIDQVEAVTDAQVRLIASRYSVDVSGGNSVTPRPLDPGDTAASLTALYGTFSAQGTESDLLGQRGFNIRQGLLWIPTQQNKIWVRGGGLFVLRFAAAPPSATDTFNWTVSVVEYG